MILHQTVGVKCLCDVVNIDELNKKQTLPRALNQADYLLGVEDVARQGALRFKTEPQGKFSR